MMMVLMDRTILCTCWLARTCRNSDSDHRVYRV